MGSKDDVLATQIENLGETFKTEIGHVRDDLKLMKDEHSRDRARIDSMNGWMRLFKGFFSIIAAGTVYFLYHANITFDLHP